jgi:hypothetical protein
MSQNRYKHYNRLINEKSPYLLQHADNPVDWYPWCSEAFERAKVEDKPIFLSIGYSTCHWCHVMERESFQDKEVASLMNETFICIKVDREERPDIDSIYMKVCQMMTGRGGWPLTIIMTPDKKPFFAGTYIPKESRFGMIGMLDLIPRIKELWENNRREIFNVAEGIVSVLKQVSVDVGGDELGEDELKDAYIQLEAQFDPEYGGFGTAPKFPSPHNLMFLLRYWKRTGDGKALEMVERTLQRMRLGGIYDHIGFGFHRYSTDRRWMVPHFEKMLYDQALLSIAYIEAYQATGQDEYAEVAREIFEYVLRDMQDPLGGFYSAEDADSEGEEGKFYLWTKSEIEEILDDDEVKLAFKLFNITKEGNYRDEATGQRTGKNILYLEKPLEHIALELGIDENELRGKVKIIRDKLFAEREKREKPDKDDKILTDWNGLMISALAKGGRVLDDKKYTISAVKSADFILNNLFDSSGMILHRFRQGDAGIFANLDDYAFFIWGLIELYQAVFEVKYLKTAVKLAEDMIEHFWDRKHSGFYFTPDYGEELLIREKIIYDGAVPSGNSIAMMDLLILGKITGNSEFEEKAWQISRAFSNKVKEYPSAYTFMLSALDFALGPSYEVVVAGKPEAEDVIKMLKALEGEFIPNKVIIFRPDDESAEICKIAEFTKNQKSIDGKATAYVCINYTCEQPTTDIDKMMKFLSRRI